MLLCHALFNIQNFDNLASPKWLNRAGFDKNTIENRKLAREILNFELSKLKSLIANKRNRR